MKRLIALTLALLLFLSGCAGQETPSQTSESEPATEPEETTAAADDTFGLSYLPEYGLNPYTCTATVNRAVFSLLYESLFVVSNQFRAEPLLCESFTASEDGKTYVYRLLPNVTFSDGTPLTAQDAAASVNAARDSALYAARLEHITNISVLDDSTLSIVLDTPYENFSLMLDIPVVRADTVSADTPIGTGPYALDGSCLRRNMAWWQEGEPAVSVNEIPLTAADTPNALRDNFEFGSTDLIYCDPNSPAAVGYRCDFEVWEVPTTILHYLGFNVRGGLFASDTLRTAVTYMVDRDTLANACYGGFAIPAMLPCSPDSDLSDAQLAAQYAYDLTRFQAARNNSGVQSSEESPGVFLVCSDDPTRVAVAETLNETFRACGLYLTIRSLPLAEYKTALSAGNFDLYLGEVRLTANFDLSEFFSSEGTLNYGGISNSELTQLCASCLENSGNYADLCAGILNTAPICPVVFKSYAIYVSRGKLASITPAVDYLFHNAITARTLADADRTYDRTGTAAEDGGETSAPTDESSQPLEP